MPIIQLLAAGGGVAPSTVEFVIVGGGQGGYLDVNTVGPNGYGGSVTQGSFTAPSGQVTIAVGAGGAGLYFMSSGSYTVGLAGSASSITLPNGTGFTAQGGSSSTPSNFYQVTTWAGNHSGQVITNSQGSGGLGGFALAGCWWAQAGFPQSCGSGSDRPQGASSQAGLSGAVYLRELNFYPQRSTSNATVTESGGYRVYTFLSGGSILF